MVLASDFDDTLYIEDSEDTILRNVSAIKKFMNKGNIFCIITGRCYSDIKLLLNKYNIPYSYLICEDGAKIFNNMDYCIDTIYLKREVIEEIIPILDGYDYYLDDGYNKTFNLDDCVKIVINCSDKSIQESLVDKIRSKVDIHVYASKYHVNIIDESVDKASSLDRLFELEKLDYKDLRVIGDNDNDYTMLKRFKGGVMSHHNSVLDSLKLDEYDELNQYIEELM